MEGCSAHRHRRAWLGRQRHWLWPAVILSGLMALWPAWHLPQAAQVWLLAGAAVALGYALPCIPHPSGWRSLRHIPLAKTFWIVSVWTLATAIIPLLAHRAIAAPS